MPYHETIESALKLIQAISPVGREKLNNLLSRAGANNRQQLIGWMHEADNLAYFFQGTWKEAARAWILIKYLSLYWAGDEQGALPTPQERSEKLNELRHRSEQSLRSEITDLVTGRGVLRIFSDRQRHPSRQAWTQGFTDPDKHNRNAYRYLIHGMRPTTSIEVDKAKSPLRAAYLKKALKGNIGKIDLMNNALQLLSAQLFLTNPEALCSEVLSCSVISNAKNKTYGDCSFGFVLSAPAANICNASSSDMAASTIQHKSRADKLVEETTTLGRMLKVDDFICNLVDGYYVPDVQSPQALLNSTQPDSHNEVLILGSISGLRVKPIAIFVKVTTTGMLWKSFLEDDTQYGLGALMIKCSRQHKIDIIDIPDNRGQPSKMDFHTWKSMLSKMFI